MALSSPDALTGVDRITTGQGSVYRPIDAASATTTGAFAATPESPLILTVAPGDVDQAVQVSFDPAAEPLVTVSDSTGDPLWLPASLLRFGSPEELELDQGTFDCLEASDGDDDAVATFTVPAGRFAIVFAESLADPGASLTYTSSVPVSSDVDDDDGVALAVGTRHEGRSTPSSSPTPSPSSWPPGRSSTCTSGRSPATWSTGSSRWEPNRMRRTRSTTPTRACSVSMPTTTSSPPPARTPSRSAPFEVISIGYVLDVQPG